MTALKTVAVALTLAAVFVISLPWLILSATRDLGWLHMPIGGLRWLGVLAIGLGVYLYVWSLVSLLRRGTSALPGQPPTALATSGWYGRVRHPLLLGVVLILLGEAIATASLALLAFALAYWAWLHVFVRLKEEPDLQRVFGDQYRAYAAEVPRWIPRARPWRDSQSAERGGPVPPA